MLQRSRLIPVWVAVAVAITSGFAANPAVHAASLAGPVAYKGTLTTAPSSPTAPATFTLQTMHNGVVTVSVTSSTKIVRRFDAPTTLDVLGVGDVLVVRGTNTGTGTMTATWIRDTSIQAAFTPFVGQVTGVSSSSVTAIVQRNAARAPFETGSTQTLPVGSSTQVVSGTNTVTGTTSLLSAGQRITAVGVFNRHTQMFISTFRIRILSNTNPLAGLTKYTGTLTAAPSSTTAPTTLSLQTANGTLSVSVAATTTIVRRFDGPSGLDELGAGDGLVVWGASAGASAVDAVRIRDVSIQAAFTRLVGKVSLVGSDSVTVDVMRDRVRAPFPDKSSQTLPVGSATQVISGTTVMTGTSGLSLLSAGQRITSIGVYDRVAQKFVKTFRIRILR